MTYSRSLLLAALLLLATGAAAQDDRVTGRNALATGFRLLDGNTQPALTEALAKFAEARNLSRPSTIATEKRKRCLAWGAPTLH